MVILAIERPPATAATLLEVRHCHVDYDSVEPGRELTIAAPAIKVAVDLDEDGLDEIVDIAIVANQPGELTVDLVHVGAIEGLKGTRCAFSDPFYELVTSHGLSCVHRSSIYQTPGLG